MKRIKFQGNEYILTGNREGAITTPEAYASWETSYAHLFPNGVIKRFHQVIGSIEDIEFIDDVPEVEETKMAEKGLRSFRDNPFSFMDTAFKERFGKKGRAE